MSSTAVPRLRRESTHLVTRGSRGEKTKQCDGLQVYTSVRQTRDVYMVFMQRDRAY